MANITNHAKRRMKQRCGVSKRACSKMAKKVFTNGVKHSETTGDLNKWITTLFFRHKTANNIRIYGGQAYIFCGHVLVTVIPIPNEMKNTYKTMIIEK